MSDFPDIVEDIFPSVGFHIISGSRGAGKTAFEIWMERSVLRGEPFLGHQTWKPPFWGTLIFDRSADDRLQWWAAAGMEPQPYYCLTADKLLTPQTLIDQKPAESLKMAERCIAAMKPPPGSVITIDVANFLSGDVNLSYRSGFAHGWGISRIANDRDITIFGMMHGGKQKAGQQYLRLTDRCIASTGFLGTADTIAYLATPQESAAEGASDGKQLFEWEPHHHAPERFTLRRTENGLFECVDGNPIETQDLALLERIPFDEWVAAVDLRPVVGGVKSTLSRRMAVLFEAGLVERRFQGRMIFYRRVKLSPDS